MSVEAKAAAALASEMLSHIVKALDGLPDRLEAHLAELGQVRDRAKGLLADRPPASGVNGIASELRDEPRLDAAAGDLASVLSALLAARRAGEDTRFSLAVAEIAREAVAAEGARVLDERESGIAEMADDRDPVLAVEYALTAQDIERFFADRFPDAHPGRVAALDRLAGGYSKDTFAFRLTGKVDGVRDIILRRDLPFGPGENTVIEEFAILNAVADAGLPVARPFWCETDEGYAGRPFLLLPKLPGSAIPMDWPGASRSEKERVCCEIAGYLARLHRLDLASLGAAVPDHRRTMQDVVRDYVRHWRSKWMRRRTHPSAILEVAYDWLEANVPAGAPRACLVHGDMSLANTLAEDNRVVAILDWEFWHLGDPIEDLSYFRWGTEPHVPWETIMSAYRAAGGEDYAPDRARFYEIWRSVRNATTTSTAWRGFLNGKYPATKAAYQGVGFYRYCLIDLANKLKEVQL